MCPVIQTRSISMLKLIKDEPAEEAKQAAKKPPARKPRKKKSSSRVAKKKRRKPKFLSLRSSRLSVRNDAVSANDDDGVDAANAKKEELELFPLRPEMMTHDDVSDDDVAMLFESDGGATLQGLLTSATTSASTVSSQSNYGFVTGDGDVDIVRTAMRGRSGGDRSSEKWVCYSELVKEEVDLTATTSSASAASTCCSVGADDRIAPHRDQRQLALKLDYVEVLNAWSDKGSLFIKTEYGESPPQTVPDLLQDQLFHHLHDSNANIEDLWRVPEEGDGLASNKMQRQESLLRYKRKRESRLFSKQIRYEVRKLNAEKRPRVKGRFVRKS